jgi:hypothetical protein
MLLDRQAAAGETSGHYFHQDLWAARLIYASHPSAHLDVGSRLDGFVAHVLTFMPVTIIDARPCPDAVKGLSCLQCDATTLRGIGDDSVVSLSCLHAAEHFGLGRYGDAIDPFGTEQLCVNLTRVLAPGGTLYFSVPIGRPRTEFNAHRIFHPDEVTKMFPSLILAEFSAVDDDGRFIDDALPATFRTAEYSCGLFRFKKHCE